MTHHKIQKNVSLQAFNTLGVDALARSFSVIASTEQLGQMHSHGALDQEVLILGSGSNVLFAGEVRALVLKNEIHYLDLLEETTESVVLKIGGGVIWHDLVTHSVNQGWGGIENLALIPGTVGAAPVQNIGAYGVEISSRVESVEAFDLKEGGVRQFGCKECRFGYRDSIFKTPSFRNRFFITSVTLRLDLPPHRVNDSYRALSQWLSQQGISNPSIRQIYDGVVAVRTRKLPDPKEYGNAGSFFKNPVLERDDLDRLIRRFGEIPHYSVDEAHVKLPAGWLIEAAGWKGRRVGQAGTYDNQALVIVNHGGATGKEIWALACRIRDAVRKQFGIELVPEVNRVGTDLD